MRRACCCCTLPRSLCDRLASRPPAGEYSHGITTWILLLLMSTRMYSPRTHSNSPLQQPRPRVRRSSLDLSICASHPHTVPTGEASRCVCPVPALTWEERAPVPVQMWQGRAPYSPTRRSSARAGHRNCCPPAPRCTPLVPHLRRDWAHPSHICAGTGLTPSTSAPGLGSPLPHLHRDLSLAAARYR